MSRTTRNATPTTVVVAFMATLSDAEKGAVTIRGIVAALGVTG